MTNSAIKGPRLALRAILRSARRENLQFDHSSTPSPAAQEPLLAHTPAMKLHADKADLYAISACGDGWVTINGLRHERSLVLSSTEGVLPWDCGRFDDLTAAHFDALIASQPELVVFGSGARLRFVRPALLQGLIARRIGVETMDTGAACRTYNILAGEGRRVTAALLLGD